MNVAVYQRNDVLLRFSVRDENGDALDLSGASLVFEVDGVIRKTTGDGIVITDAANGEIEIALTADDTDIAKGSYRLELLVIDVDGHRYTAASGSFGVRESLIE